MCSGPNHTLSQASQIHLSAFFLCSDSWQLFLASRSQAILHSPDLLQQIWIFPPNGGSLGLSHPSCFLCFLFSDSSFINGAWRLKSVLFFFNKINYFHVILFHSWILPFKGCFVVVVVFWVFFGCCFFGYCLFNEVLAEGTAPGVWNFPSAPASHALCFLWTSPRSPAAGAVLPVPIPCSPPPLAPAPLASLRTMNTQIPMLLPRYSQIPSLLGEYFLSLFFSIS